MYLLFQLKSHAYMYESTPQHIIDEESAPGPVAQWMESSDDDTSSSSSSDSDGSSGSNTTAKRIRRVMRVGRRRRKSSFGSKDTADVGEAIRTPSLGTSSTTPIDQFADESWFQSRRPSILDAADDGDEEDNRRSRKNSFIGSHLSKKERRKDRDHKRQERRQRKKAKRNGDDTIAEGVVNEKAAEAHGADAPRRVDFAVVEPENQIEDHTDSSQKRARTLRTITASIRPQIPKSLSQNVFTQGAPSPIPAPVSGPIPRVRYGIRRTNSLPDRLNQSSSGTTDPIRILPSRVNCLAVAANKEGNGGAEEENISRTTAVLLLLISTGLVAVCAEFMVDSINAVVSGNSGLSETFIGLIILPIVGNAAEHVTAVTVASKNKMDLAIGVAVGSSIQICISSSCPASPSNQLTVLSTLRNSLRRSSWLVHVQRNVSVLHPLRNRLAVRLGLYCQLSRPRWSLELPRRRIAVCSLRYHCCRRILLSFCCRSE
jgi:Ca2+:H+ antiporter